ncbi:MAG: carboxypeptidase-like regulatory domain-containing protein [Bacteroidetes bacterium]|nr:carboxypeptidase-like regulatory domain-containing protein [Bacteroidota bacterium]
MNRIRLIYIFAFFYAISLSAQTAILKGKITEKENNLPMIQAKVVVDISKGLATTSNVDGNYELKLNPGTYEIVFGYIGKVDRTETITIQENEVKILNVSLSDKIYDALKQVVISSSKFEKKSVRKP